MLDWLLAAVDDSCRVDQSTSRPHYPDWVEAVGFDETQAGIDTGLVGSGIAKVVVEADHADAGSFGYAVADAGHAGTGHGCSETETDRHNIGSDHPGAAAHADAGPEHGDAGSDHADAGFDHADAVAGHIGAGAEHAGAEFDHTDAGSDYTDAGSDHIGAGAGQAFDALEFDHA